jgi:hypothetical protein
VVSGSKGIDTIDLAYYTVADGDGQTQAAREADVDVVATQDLSRSAAHPFYTRLNQILDKHDFDGYVEGLCQRFYAEEIGRPAASTRRRWNAALRSIVQRDTGESYHDFGPKKKP